MKSCDRSVAFEESNEIVDGEFVEPVDDEVGVGEFLVGAPGRHDPDRTHASGLRGVDAGPRVLDDDASRGCDADAFGGEQEHLGIGLPVDDLAAAHELVDALERDAPLARPIPDGGSA